MLDNQKSFRTQYRKQLRLSFTNSVRKCKIRAKLPELYGLAFFRQDYSPSRRAARALVLVTVHCEYKHFSISNKFPEHYTFHTQSFRNCWFPRTLQCTAAFFV